VLGSCPRGAAQIAGLAEMGGDAEVDGALGGDEARFEQQ